MLLAAVALAFLLPGAAPAREGRWTVYKDCQLQENPSNDGDSFHVKTARYKYLFRLYFADCPETSRQVPERVKEQAAHFGVPEDTVLKAGKRAREFTRQFLARGFTVSTKKEDARGASRVRRYYAVVEAGGKDLAEELVAHGLARAYGEGTNLPDGGDEHRWRGKLARAEKSARAQHLGIWRNDREPAEPKAGGEP
jgi:endonuclease YncB( thermonuclease family)